MKRLFFVLFMCGFLTNLYSQNYLAQYSYHLADAEEMNGVLVFNTSVWRYDLHSNLVIEMKIEGNSDPEDELSEEGNAISMFNFRSLDKNYYLDEEPLLLDRRVIKGELIKPEWEIIGDSVSKIATYDCIMAKGNVCGRKYTVWFTPEIAVNCGPWKLWGLPGLILNARSDDGEVDIQLRSLNKTELSPKEPLVKETIRREDYKVQLKEAMQKLKRKLSAYDTGNRGMDVDVDVKINIPDLSLLE
jgi:GLPGLI family protein